MLKRKTTIMELNLVIFNIFFCLIISPIGEWVAHYILHSINNKRHFIHHERHRLNIVTPEKTPLIISAFAYYFGYYYIVFGFMRYWIVHTLIHFYPEYVPRLTEHHNTHHQYSKYNLAVSSIWPDMIFRTLYTKKIKNKNNT